MLHHALSRAGLALSALLAGPALPAPATAAPAELAGPPMPPGPGADAGGRVPRAAEADCPAELTGARALVLVIADGMDTVSATITRHRREGEGWTPVGGPQAAVLGRKGLGWAWNQTALAARIGATGDPVKREGDGRTPAGLFALGAPFGFEASGLPGYVRLEKGRQVCVDDLRSPAYNTIIDAGALAKGMSHEAMGSVPLYRAGVFVRHATSRPAKGGSCIFFHVWRGAGRGTAGCVAAPEPFVKALQATAAEPGAVTAILPRKAAAKLGACLPVSR